MIIEAMDAYAFLVWAKEHRPTEIQALADEYEEFLLRSDPSFAAGMPSKEKS